MMVFRGTALAVGLATFAACGDSSDGLGPELQLASVSTIVERLEATGLEVRVVGPVQQSFYPSAHATLLEVESEHVTIFEYRTAAEALQNSTSRPLVTWAEPPHFYLNDRFMALYVGRSGEILDAMEEVFGDELD